jgi:hypothetical protein
MVAVVAHRLEDFAQAFLVGDVVADEVAVAHGLSLSKLWVPRRAAERILSSRRSDRSVSRLSMSLLCDNSARSQ